MGLNIFNYTDHRAFIKDYYETHKLQNPKFSYRVFAKKAGFSSSAFLPLVISGKKTIGKDSLRRLGSAMGLSKKEQVYFESLVWFNQAKDEASKEYYHQLLRSIKKDKPGKVIKGEQFEYLSHWYYPVIREMVTLPTFKEDKLWIRARLNDRVTIRQIRDALDDMLKLDLLKRDDAGRLRQVDASIVTEDEVSHTAVLMIHQQMLLLAHEMLVATKGVGSEVSGMTMAVSKKQYKEIVTMIRDFQNEIIKYIETHSDIPESVVQLNVQLFNLLK